ncbi:alpha-ketoglutarate-dependent dioxygenase AlkB [Tahibacter sp. P2K]|uniref:Alpha-ketoglutarate-dependent dioxygenase AlkB n=1 Tax=Tahibacter harae TaxID=2963937 RepID=A0ABT1QV23_9GAMM|nr:alpha-ketoglutarate-dependent dioxygenase AlkB [Tahibacter harae]
MNGLPQWREPRWQNLAVPAGAELRLGLDVLAEPDALLQALRAEIPWEQHRLRLYGREVASPRLSCWIGDTDAVYTYSRTRFVPQPWTPLLAALRDGLAALTAQRFNSVLCNLYRDGNDSMGLHSDDEPELGLQPLIASLSLGATRRFRLRHKRDPARRLELELPSGSLLVMSGTTQQEYRHELPKALRVKQARVNLTFRQVVARG